MQAQYLIVLCSFKEQLQQHVRVHAVEAVMACREIENTLQALTGNQPISPPYIHILFVSYATWPAPSSLDRRLKQENRHKKKKKKKKKWSDFRYISSG